MFGITVKVIILAAIIIASWLIALKIVNKSIERRK